MNKLTSLALPSLLVTMVVGCVTDGAPDVDDPTGTTPSSSTQPKGGSTPGFTPKTCQEIVDRTPSATDGDYTLYIQNQAGLPWTAYCADMHASPREYLTLTNVGGGKNTSMYKAGANAVGTDVITAYQQVRIDPISLAIDVGDTTFATSTGSLSHAGTNGATTVTSMPFGFAMTCGGSAKANIDLSGTPFRAEDPFPVVGVNMMTGYQLSADRKALDIALDGANCGWIGPTHNDPLDGGTRFGLRTSYAL